MPHWFSNQNSIAVVHALPHAPHPLRHTQYLSAQQYYKAQAALWLNASLAPFMLSVASKGLIDCYRDGC